MKKLPIGIRDFKTLIDSDCYYIDKTLLIDDILLFGQVLLLTRPRRFGKTLNLSMLKYFFEKSDESHRYLFSGLAIEQRSSTIGLQGRFPVIFLSFKSIKESDWQTTYEKFTLVVYEEYARHPYLLSSPLLEAEERVRYQSILERTSSRAELENSLQFLAKLLHRFYREKVVVLVDEYYVPVQTAFINGMQLN